MGLVLQRLQKPKRKLDVFAKNQTKAHLMREEVLPESSDEGGALEKKGVSSCLDDNSEQDSDWRSSDVNSDSTDLDIQEILPFHCDECGRIFKSEIWFQRHKAKGCIKSLQYESICVQAHAVPRGSVKASDFDALENEQLGCRSRSNL